MMLKYKKIKDNDLPFTLSNDQDKHIARIRHESHAKLFTYASEMYDRLEVIYKSDPLNDKHKLEGFLDEIKKPPMKEAYP